MPERIVSPLINKQTLLDLPSIDDAGMLGYEAMGLIRLFVPDTSFSLHVTGSDGDDQLYGLLATSRQLRLGLFYLSGLMYARNVMEIPVVRDDAYMPEDIRVIAYRHSVRYPSSNPPWAQKPQSC